MSSAKDTIRKYLKDDKEQRKKEHKNQREIPVYELAEEYGLKASTISNAIKELEYQNEIVVDRRPLKRGRYTVIWLKDDSTRIPFIHEKEQLDKRLLAYFTDNKRKVTLSDLIDYYGENIEEGRITANLIEEALKDLLVERRISSEADKYWLKGAELSSKVDELFIDKTINELKSLEYDPLIFKQKLDSLYPPSKDDFSFITKFITPLMYEVGSRWAQTILSTAEEHVISERIEKILVERINNHKMNGTEETIVMAPVEGESHVISLLSLELIFQGLRYNIINLGEPLPLRSLIQYIHNLSELPSWLFLTISLNTYQGTLLRTLSTLKTAFKGKNLKIAVGGQGLNEHPESVFSEADEIVKTPQDLQTLIEKMTKESKSE